MQAEIFNCSHTLPTPLTREEALAIAKQVKDHCTGDAHWVRSWVQLNNEGKIVKICCEWNAKAASDINKIIEKVQLPFDGLHPMITNGLYPIMFDRSHHMPVTESEEVS